MIDFVPPHPSRNKRYSEVSETEVGPGLVRLTSDKEGWKVTIQALDNGKFAWSMEEWSGVYDREKMKKIVYDQIRQTSAGYCGYTLNLSSREETNERLKALDNDYSEEGMCYGVAAAGAGLGLYTVKLYVKAMKGSIRVESKLGAQI